MKILFICQYNEVRSRTAEKLYNVLPHQAKSCGISDESAIEVTPRLIRWADIIFTMEEGHADFIRRNLGAVIGFREIQVLNIEDSYYYMEPSLVKKIRESVEPHLSE